MAEEKQGFLSRVKKSLGFGGTAYHLPVTGGYLPSEWGDNAWNWWQQGLDPIQGGQNAIVGSCVDAYAQTIASLWGQHVREEQDGGKTIITSSALSRVMRNPNEYQTRSDFMLNMVRDLLYTGNAYALATRNERGEVDSLHITPSRGVQVYVEPETKAVFYGLSENEMVSDYNNLTMMVPARDVLHIKLYSRRGNPLVGVSPLENLASTLAANNAISQTAAAFFNNQARPSGVISVDSERPLSKEQMASLRQAWNNQSKGLNSGQVPILNSGMKWTPMTMTSQDAQLIQAFNMGKETIMQAFRVPPALLGDQTATYNNAETLVSQWLATGLGFMIEHIELSFDKFFKLGANNFTEFNTDSLLRTDFKGHVDAVVAGINGSLFTPNEARARLGLASVPNGETIYGQQQVVPLGYRPELNDTAPEPAAPPIEVNPEEAKIYALAAIKKAMSA